MTDEDMDPVLARAARAYRDQHHGASPDAARTRARILATREQGRHRTMVAMAAAALLAVGLGVPTAWAWSTGRLSEWLQGDDGASQPVPQETAPVPAAPASVRSETVRSETIEVTPVPVAPSEPEPSVVPSGLPSSPVPTPSGAIAAPTEDAIDAREPVDPTERRAYRAAHALHFEARDPAGALTAWDRYLAAYPSGRFAIEARYNSALCLVRLGRSDEARDALAPFADGRHGEYRQREAAALIEALSE